MYTKVTNLKRRNVLVGFIFLCRCHVPFPRPSLPLSMVGWSLCRDLLLPSKVVIVVNYCQQSSGSEYIIAAHYVQK